MKQKIAYYLRTSHYLQQIGVQEDQIEKGWLVYKDEGVSGRISSKIVLPHESYFKILEMVRFLR
jgi:DNA invertase Pin-like site-specific DNA recombinase